MTGHTPAFRLTPCLKEILWGGDGFAEVQAVNNAIKAIAIIILVNFLIFIPSIF